MQRSTGETFEKFDRIHRTVSNILGCPTQSEEDSSRLSLMKAACPLERTFRNIFLGTPRALRTESGDNSVLNITPVQTQRYIGRCGFKNSLKTQTCYRHFPQKLHRGVSQGCVLTLEDIAVNVSSALFKT